MTSSPAASSPSDTWLRPRPRTFLDPTAASCSPATKLPNRAARGRGEQGWSAHSLGSCIVHDMAGCALGVELAPCPLCSPSTSPGARGPSQPVAALLPARAGGPRSCLVLSGLGVRAPCVLHSSRLPGHAQRPAPSRLPMSRPLRGRLGFEAGAVAGLAEALGRTSPPGHNASLGVGGPATATGCGRAAQDSGSPLTANHPPNPRLILALPWGLHMPKGPTEPLPHPSPHTLGLGLALSPQLPLLPPPAAPLFHAPPTHTLTNCHCALYFYGRDVQMRGAIPARTELSECSIH